MVANVWVVLLVPEGQFSKFDKSLIINKNF